MGMMDAILSLDQLVDESDPDVDFPNSFHAFQTAEGIRQAHPDKGTVDRQNHRALDMQKVWYKSGTQSSLSLRRLVPVGGPDP